ncbi:MAG TPA: hypothetical protein DCM45_07185 [Clostridiales bacterium]|nr:hypothetical protein [Clostridiales bacterium]
MQRGERQSQGFFQLPGAVLEHKVELVKVKINEAKMLLLHSDQSLVDIANLLSFSSQSQFSVVFKKETGMTSSEFRRQAEDL